MGVSRNRQTALMDLDRLLAQAAAWDDWAERLLTDIGVGAGWRVADLGCGPAGILQLAARQVGPNGQVVGVERSPFRAMAAQLAVASAGLGNVEIRVGDAAATGLPSGTFDLVHARFLTQEVDPALLVPEMIRLVRPGGVIAMQEPGAEPWHIDPEPAGYREVEPHVRERFLARDGASGAAVTAGLRAAGATVLGEREVRLAIAGGHPYAKTPWFALRAAGPSLVDAGILDLTSRRRAERALARAAANPTVRHQSFSVIQVWARPTIA